jgi:hypothetical protein
MAEADSERIIPSPEAIELVSRAVGSPQIADRLLTSGLGEERVRWRCKLLEGDPNGWDLPTSEVAASGKFWRHGPEVRWSEGWARTRFLVGCPSIYMIGMVEEDVRCGPRK